MSLKRIPSVGKSLMSRIFARSSATSIARLYYSLHVAARKTQGGAKVSARGWHRDTLGRHPSRHGRAPHALAAPQLANFTATTSEGMRRGIQLARGCCEGFVRRTPVLLPEQVQRLFQLALVEFAPDWEIAGVCTELSLHKAEHWASGLGTFGLVLRNRMTGGAKALGGQTREPRDRAVGAEQAERPRRVARDLDDAHSGGTRTLDVEHFVVPDVHRALGPGADGAQREGEDLGVRLAHAHLVREGRVPEVAEQPVALEELAQRDAGRAH